MYLVFDIGGTKTRIGVSSDLHHLDSYQVFSTPKTYSDSAQLFTTAVQQLAPNQVITAIAGGVPGHLLPDKSSLDRCPHLPNWCNQPLSSQLTKLFNCPVHLENDAALVGLGEATQGAGKGHRIVAYITVSTGVGGARVVDQHIDASATGFEPGHQLINGSTTLENLVSGTAVEQRYHQSPKDIHDPAVWQQVEADLSLGLVNTILHWSPNIVVLGGAMSKSLSVQNLSQNISRHLTIYTPPPVVKFQLDDAAGLIGSLEYLRQQQP